MTDHKKTSLKTTNRRCSSTGALRRRRLVGQAPKATNAVHSVNVIQGVPKNSAPTRKVCSAPPPASAETILEESSGLNDDQKIPKKDRRKLVLKNVQLWVGQALQKGVEGLAAEFQSISAQALPKGDFGVFAANTQAGKNRFKDVPCVEATRVHLEGDDDYIHANFVGTPMAPRRFICTQAPLESTTADFWKMVVQERIEKVLMLCDFVERNLSKSTNYFPLNQGETVSFFDFEVTNMEMSFMDSPDLIVQTDLRVRSSRGMARVTHYHWRGFPDRSVPPVSGVLLSLLRDVRGSLRPIVVHCSAGIGRSGVAIAVEFLQERFNAGQAAESMRFLLPKLRSQRALCIQTEAQYLYIHRIMFLYFSQKKLLEKSDALKKFCSDYDVFVEKFSKSIRL
ncbi:hypothetical protein QR680_005242 [Steinernema hermaphroditum]|uniref:Tyrosine-protein phosphatase domain-containing protein n=1 Tax=Steinernema hermaphroditum TaxID=289476 RepID=A0AA39LVA5_9BILA|nr:hypothetical protein QR680_005242 [Steinernema hermaphroditum]